MDQFDARLLEALQRDARLTADGLSNAVGLSADACRKRAARLRKEGVVDADIAVLNPEKVGRGLFLIVEVQLEQERKTDLERFKRLMLEAPEVMQCFYVTGAADFILIMTARDMAEYEAFTQRYFFEETNVTHFTTSVVMDRVKLGLFIPVAASETPSNNRSARRRPRERGKSKGD